MTTTKLKERRKAVGLKAKDVAEAAGIRQPVFSRYETGKRIPKANVMLRIAKVLNCTIEDLLD